ncbi:hypothetical protein HETIRDRAFT_448018 [Heterobasidion irregulare TC 32-1]|uniref:Uncharacterized protein n=1 Tax=Heterobasidion irregulare (strain TC 32-1) TaxID=747525 RepID=W4KQ43_HETIT|nr:uncharacterized protein HETIRDRAFT_448018 [Heterobasidion irregulare TC 32-1]ETW87520.1 hypothetical protein HETIRDRAFT_448018 [Heterobasidion irregulare TC 32-1]
MRKLTWSSYSPFPTSTCPSFVLVPSATSPPSPSRVDYDLSAQYHVSRKAVILSAIAFTAFLFLGIFIALFTSFVQFKHDVAAAASSSAAAASATSTSH